mgnify:CR=1 FL=1
MSGVRAEFPTPQERSPEQGVFGKDFDALEPVQLMPVYDDKKDFVGWEVRSDKITDAHIDPAHALISIGELIEATPEARQQAIEWLECHGQKNAEQMLLHALGEDVENPLLVKPPEKNSKYFGN